MSSVYDVIPMGRIDAVISDELESEFRMEITKRLGGKKGDLQKAIQQAIELWIKGDVIEKLKQVVLSGNIDSVQMKQLVDVLVTQGKASLPALTDILSVKSLTTKDTRYITRALHQVSTEP